jgi:hypothetical protein
LCQVWPRTITREDIAGLEAALFDPPVPHVHRLGYRMGLVRPGRMRKDRRNLLSQLGWLVSTHIT